MACHRKKYFRKKNLHFASKIWIILYSPGLVFFLSDIFHLPVPSYILSPWRGISISQATTPLFNHHHQQFCNTQNAIHSTGKESPPYTANRLRWCCSHLTSGPWSFLNWTPHPSATRRPSSWCFWYSSRSYLVKPHFFETKIF